MWFCTFRLCVTLLYNIYDYIYKSCCNSLPLLSPLSVLDVGRAMSCYFMGIFYLPKGVCGMCV